ncbi:FAD/NAD(P)-binding domain-containing protein [Ramicandelaber brevisporus]|nr:FAD/NAD(P)-binding domain-containing protein [Ramicandelaber brevisporus]
MLTSLRQSTSSVLATARRSLFVKSAAKSEQRQRLVILGSGFAAFEALRNVDTRLFDTVVISPRNYFVFTPLLASAACGTLEPRCTLEPIRNSKLASSNTHVYLAKCEDIDFGKRIVKCVSNATGLSPTSAAESAADGSSTNPAAFDIEYDQLVVAVGARSNTFNTPGVSQHAFFLKDIEDARRIRSRVIECFERASQPHVTDEEKKRLLHFAIVGGGPTGMEYGAELHDLIHEDLRGLFVDVVAHAKISIYDVAPTVLGSFDKKLADYATNRFRRQGIEIKTSTSIKSVSATHLYLKHGKPADATAASNSTAAAAVVNGEEEVPYGMLIWATGITEVPLIERIGASVVKDGRKRVVTDASLRPFDVQTNKPIDGVYVLGDCGTIQNYELPATGQVAKQQGKYLAKTLNAAVRQSPSEIPTSPPPFSYHHMGSLAYVGGWRALFELKPMPTHPHDPNAPEPEEAGGVLSNLRVRASGLGAWLFWRSAYMTNAVSIRNKILIPGFWFLTWLLGRDISKF